MPRAAARMPAIEPRGLRLDDACAYVGIGKTKFLDMVASRRLPAGRKVDGMMIWDRRALDRWMDELFDAADDPYARVA